MTGLQIINNQRVYHDALTAMSNSTRRAIKENCEVTEHSPTPDMSVDISTGSVYFGDTEVAVTGTTVSVSASDPSNDRMDLVVVNSSGVVSVLSGDSTKSPTDPRPPVLDPETYVVLARIYVDDGVTSIVDSKITDLRVFFTIAGAGGSGSGIASYVHTQSSGSSTWTVAHNLNDDKPQIQCYDSSLEAIEPDTIEIDSVNQATITFSGSNTGYAIVHAGIFAGGIGTGTFLPDTNNAYDVGSGSYKWKDAYFSGEVFADGGFGLSIIKSYLHTQGSSSATWSVTHNLNDSYPIILCYDNSGNLIEPTSIAITDANSLDITFGSSITGYAKVMGGLASGGNAGGDFIPVTDNVYDLGSASYRWKDLYFSGSINTSASVTVSGDLTVGGKINVTGGVDPTYVQYEPQAGDSGIPNNSIFVDSSDSYKLKLKDNSGTSTEIGSGGGAGAVIFERKLEGELFTGFLLPININDALVGLSVSEVRISATSLPGTQAIKVDIRKNGLLSTNSIFTSDTPIEISTTQIATNGIYMTGCDSTSSTVGTPGTTIDSTVNTLSADDVLFVDITQVGSTLTGTDLVITITVA